MSMITCEFIFLILFPGFRMDSDFRKSVFYIVRKMGRSDENNPGVIGPASTRGN